MAVAAIALPDSGAHALTATSRNALPRALARCTDGHFRDVPVDWWDEGAEVWRPTAVISGATRVHGVRTHAEVLVPSAGGASMRSVRIDDLRLSWLLTAGVARFWVTRYRRLLLLTLLERAELPDASLALLRPVHERMLGDELLARDVWETAFRVGAGGSAALNGHEGAVSDDPIPARSLCAALDLSANTGARDQSRFADAAIPLLALDVVRLHGALREAGMAKRSICAHPLLVTVAALFNAAIASAGYAAAAA